MYFVHPQIKLNKFIKAKLSLFKSVDLKKLTEKLSFYFPNKQIIFTDMGRTAFRVIIEKLKLQNSEMILPAYICNIFYPILKQYNIKPIFLDIDLKTFHIRIDEIISKITPNTKSVLVCHTYGLPFNVNMLRSNLDRCGRSDLKIIEDCAHAFLAQKDGVFAGNFGDVSFFSLYKQFPALRGGMLVCPKDWKVKLPKTSFNFRDVLSFLNYFWPFAFFFKKFGSEYARTHLREEKLSQPGGIIRSSLSLFADFFDDFSNSLEKRKKLALLFQQELKLLGFEAQESSDNVFCYLSVLVPRALAEKRDQIVQGLKKYHIFCTRMWNEKYAIILDRQFPNTVEAAKRIINFPLQNHYSKKDIFKMVKAIKKVVSDL